LSHLLHHSILSKNFPFRPIPLCLFLPELGLQKYNLFLFLQPILIFFFIFFIILLYIKKIFFN